MNFLLSRRWQVVATLVVLASIGIYLAIRVIGGRHPFTPSAGDHQYDIATLGDYVRYKEDPKRFSNPRGVLRFDCERVRDDFVKLSRSIVAPELSISAESMVWREGSALHLADDSISDNQAFASWKNRVVELATTQHPPAASHYGTLLQSLFTSVTIHRSNAAEEFTVNTKRAGKLDACQ